MSVCGCSRLSAGVERLFASLPINRTFRNSSPTLILRHFYRRGRGEKNAPLLSLSNADNFVSSLSTKERSFLQEALKIHQNDKDINVSEDLTKTSIPTVQQLRLAAFHSAIPFIGFGFLDNAIMIAAGEYIDITIGVTFGISTMAAAALGNIVSDVSGISLAHYVELAAIKLGFEGPGLSSKQMEMPRTRFLTNLGRAIGITIGCILGMFPLFFLSSNKEEKEQVTSRES